MKAVTVQPLVRDSIRFEEVPEPDASSGSILVEAAAAGICGTDVEIASGLGPTQGSLAMRPGAAAAGIVPRGT